MKKRVAILMAIMGMVTCTVASTTWFVDARHGSNGYSGLSSFAPKRTIQAAINAASSGDYVIISGGTYHENLTLSKRLTLFSHESAVTIVDGRHAGHCLLITENASGSVIDGIVFTHGAPTNAGNKYGGGVDCLADATIRHCVFRDNGNSTTTFAGGLHTSPCAVSLSSYNDLRALLSVPVCKLVIEIDWLEEIKLMLKEANINARTVYPDLIGLGKYVGGLIQERLG